MLLSVEDVRNFTQSEAADQDDPTIELLIKGVTRSFANHTQREFEPTEGEEERTFVHNGGPFLDLAPYDLRAASVVTTGVDSETPTIATDYRLRPLPAPDGVFQRIRFASCVTAGEVTVKGVWGFAEIPDDIKHWALTTVTIWLKREVQTFERVYNIDSTMLERPQALPSAVVAGLADWRRVSLP